MGEVTVQLPIRLVPRKGTQVLLLFGSLIFFSFSVFWILMASGIVFKGAIDTPGSWFPLFGIPFVIIGLLGLVGSIAKLLPTSPWFHLALSKEAFALRSGWSLKRFAWSALSPFSVATQTLKDEGDVKRRYWVVAVRAEDAARLSDDKERYKRAIVRVDAVQYGKGDGEAISAVLADWLNEIRAGAGRSGKLTVPLALQYAVVRSPGGAPQERSSVIER